MSTDLGRALRAAAARLAGAGVPHPRRDAVLLAGHLLGVGPGEVERRALLGAPEPEGLDDLVDERARRVPLQHLTGRAPFRRLEVQVGPGVFVPRPETEVVAGLAIEAIPPGAPVRVVDLCTGSGAIAFAIKDERPDAHVHAVEASPEALAWARRNAEALGLDVDLRSGDAAEAFADLDGSVDVVVSNPPYIPPGAVPVEVEVRDHDPQMALYGGGSDGLETPVRLARAAARLLRPGGLVVIEHAEVQGEAFVARLEATGDWTRVVDRVDLTGRPRAVTAVRAEAPRA